MFSLLLKDLNILFIHINYGIKDSGSDKFNALYTQAISNEQELVQPNSIPYSKKTTGLEYKLSNGKKIFYKTPVVVKLQIVIWKAKGVPQ